MPGAAGAGAGQARKTSDPDGGRRVRPTNPYEASAAMAAEEREQLILEHLPQVRLIARRSRCRCRSGPQNE